MACAETIDPKSGSLLCLPDEVLLVVFQYLECVRDRYALSETCKRLSSVAGDECLKTNFVSEAEKVSKVSYLKPFLRKTETRLAFEFGRPEWFSSRFAFQLESFLSCLDELHLHGCQIDALLLKLTSFPKTVSKLFLSDCVMMEPAATMKTTTIVRHCILNNNPEVFSLKDVREAMFFGHFFDDVDRHHRNLTLITMAGCRDERGRSYSRNYFRPLMLTRAQDLTLFSRPGGITCRGLVGETRVDFPWKFTRSGLSLLRERHSNHANPVCFKCSAL